MGGGGKLTSFPFKIVIVNVSFVMMLTKSNCQQHTVNRVPAKVRANLYVTHNSCSRDRGVGGPGGTCPPPPIFLKL